MNISYSWLKEYIDTDLDAAEVAGILTSIGLEVESIETVDKIRGGMTGFVIGEVKTCHKHPDADKLSVTAVDIGGDSLLNIVCGAPNVAAGQKVVVATIGTTVYKGSESFQIKKAKIRGVQSEGMICAEDEIGLGNNHDGILVLPPDTPTGMPAKTYFRAEPESMFVIGLTPNRIDSASHWGVARDLAAYLRKDREVRLKKPDIYGFSTQNHDLKIDIEIENPLACRRYTGVTVSGVTIGSSPEWLQQRLKSIGMNPINNVVDITNFVLHELGQPLHAFDADQLAGKKIVVKNLPEGTPFITLDGVEHKLSADDLMICDAEKPVGIGGVFGGLHSGVTQNTRNIFIESAYFDPVSVRRTSKRHMINTDASFRFERGVDPDMVIVALKRCALLIKEIAGGTISSDITDIHPNPLMPALVQVSFSHIDRLIGKKIPHELIRSILISLDFVILAEGKDGYELEVPMFRVDVTREADVIEEILRIYGYNNIEIGETLQTSLSYSPHPDKDELVNLVSEHLCSQGFNEIMSNSLTRSAYYDKLDTFKPEHLVRIKNPLSNELNVLRQTLLFGGLETIQHNTNRQHPDALLFEFGACYFYQADRGIKDPLNQYREEFQLALFLTGRRNEPNWTSQGDEVSFYLLKAQVGNIFRKLGIPVEQLQEEAMTGKNDLFSQGLTYRKGEMILAELYDVAPNWIREFELKNAVYFALIRWESMMKFRGDHRVMHHELPRFPEVKRDLALLIDKSVSYDQVRELAYKTEGRLLKRVSLFDVYEGDRIESNKKSYAVSFILQDPDATLTDDRIDRIMNRLMDVYRRELHAEIR